MKVFDMMDRLQHMHKLIDARKTGTPEEFAQQIGVKRRMLYEIIEELKARDLPISYSRSRRTFFYLKPVSFYLDYKIEFYEQKE